MLMARALSALWRYRLSAGFIAAKPSWLRPRIRSAVSERACDAGISIMKISDLGEFGLINRIKRTAGPAQRVCVSGIGDDAAVIMPSPSSTLLATIDMLLEGVHFDRRTTDLPLTWLEIRSCELERHRGPWAGRPLLPDSHRHSALAIRRGHRRVLSGSPCLPEEVRNGPCRRRHLPVPNRSAHQV